MYFLSVVLLPQWSLSPSSQYRTQAVQIWCELQCLSWSFPPLHLFRAKHPSRGEKALWNSSFFALFQTPWSAFTGTSGKESLAFILFHSLYTVCGHVLWPHLSLLWALCCLLCYLSLSSFFTNFLFLSLLSLILSILSITATLQWHTDSLDYH